MGQVTKGESIIGIPCMMFQNFEKWFHELFKNEKF